MSAVQVITTQERLEQIEEEIAKLKSEPKPKDAWDKLNAVSGLVTGGLVTALGILATYAYNEKQRKNSEDQKKLEIAVLQAQTIQSFMPQLQSEDQKVVETALLTIAALGNSEIATDIAALFDSKGAKSAFAKIAIQSSSEFGMFAQNSLIELDLFEPLIHSVVEIHKEGKMRGAGILVSPNGQIVTTSSVVGDIKNTSNIRVKIKDEFHETEIVAVSSKEHLALLKVDLEKPTPHLTIPIHTNVKQQDRMFILIPQESGRWTISAGKVLKTGTDKHFNIDVIQTTAKSGIGPAGSPAVDSTGQLIGISFATVSLVFTTANSLISASSILKFIQEFRKNERG